MKFKDTSRRQDKKQSLDQSNAAAELNSSPLPREKGKYYTHVGAFKQHMLPSPGSFRCVRALCHLALIEEHSLSLSQPYRSAENQRTSMLRAAKPEGIYGEQASEPDSLRAKIHLAIGRLQEGLLERATEVGPFPLKEDVCFARQGSNAPHGPLSDLYIFHSRTSNLAAVS